MALAGIWQRWQDVDTVAIVSTGTGPGMAGLHHREPVILEQPMGRCGWESQDMVLRS